MERNGLKRLVFACAVWLYLFVILGFILHTSVGKTQVLGKYSHGYLLILLFVIAGFFPYLVLLRYLSRDSKYKVFSRKLYLRPVSKLLVFFLLCVVFLASAEIVMRMHNMQIRQPIENMNFHPFLQQTPRPNDGMYHQDSYGFRADEITKIKPKDTYRIIVMGGSTAYEVGVSYEQSAPKLLQDMLRKHYNRKIEVINAGVSGYTSEHSLIDYQTRVSDFEPDLVVMWLGGNDMQASCPDPNTPTVSYRPDYSHLLGPIATMVNSYFSPPVVSIDLVSVNYIGGWLSQYMYTDLQPLIDHYIDVRTKAAFANLPAITMPISSLPSYRRNLKYFIAAVKSDNVPLILGNQPNGINPRYPDLGGGSCGDKRATMVSRIKAMAVFNGATKEVAQENGVPFMDLDSQLPRTPEYFLDYLHWNEKGQRVIANYLYNYIVKGNYISGK